MSRATDPTPRRQWRRCARCWPSSTRRIELEIIDVVKNPERALRDGVLITPMLVRVGPPPERRILGRLSDRAMVLSLLGLEDARPE